MSDKWESIDLPASYKGFFPGKIIDLDEKMKKLVIVFRTKSIPMLSQYFIRKFSSYWENNCKGHLTAHEIDDQDFGSTNKVLC